MKVAIAIDRAWIDRYAEVPGPQICPVEDRIVEAFPFCATASVSQMAIFVTLRAWWHFVDQHGPAGQTRMFEPPKALARWIDRWDTATPAERRAMPTIRFALERSGVEIEALP